MPIRPLGPLEKPRSLDLAKSSDLVTCHLIILIIPYQSSQNALVIPYDPIDSITSILTAPPSLPVGLESRACSAIDVCSTTPPENDGSKCAALK